MATRLEIIEAHRDQQIVLREHTRAQLAVAFELLKYGDLDHSFPVFAAAVRDIVVIDRGMAYGLATEFLTQYRYVSGIPGAPPLPKLDNQWDLEHFLNGLHALTVASVKSNTARGLSPVKAMDAARTNAQGHAVKAVLDAGRDAVMGSISRDRRAVGWQRIVGGGACNFCTMLASRGVLYTDEAKRFAGHDHCACATAPVYRSGRTGKVSAVDEYVPSTRNISPRDKERLRQWLADNPAA